MRSSTAPSWGCGWRSRAKTSAGWSVSPTTLATSSSSTPWPLRIRETTSRSPTQSPSSAVGDADREAKRSAVVALARVLEDRRRLLKAELVSSDEGALFHIANKFDLRHRDGKQHQRYAEAFLDWIFWWYLATIELTDRLHAEQQASV